MALLPECFGTNWLSEGELDLSSKYVEVIGRSATIGDLEREEEASGQRREDNG